MRALRVWGRAQYWEHFNGLFHSLLGLAPKVDQHKGPDAIVDTSGSDGIQGTVERPPPHSTPEVTMGGQDKVGVPGRPRPAPPVPTEEGTENGGRRST